MIGIGQTNICTCPRNPGGDRIGGSTNCPMHGGGGGVGSAGGVGGTYGGVTTRVVTNLSEREFLRQVRSIVAAGGYESAMGAELLQAARRLSQSDAST